MYTNSVITISFVLYSYYLIEQVRRSLTVLNANGECGHSYIFLDFKRTVSHALP